jgi:hypothetical protein
LKNLRKIGSKDFPLIVSWYKGHKQAVPDPRALSNTGFIVDNRVAGWVLLTNSNIALIEGIISDPNSIPSLRRESLNKLVGFLIDFCLAAGYTQIIGITKNPRIDLLGKRYGFKTLPDHKILYLNASDDGDNERE